MNIRSEIANSLFDVFSEGVELGSVHFECFLFDVSVPHDSSDLDDDFKLLG